MKSVEMALKRDKFVISQNNTRVFISLSTRVPERIAGHSEVGQKRACGDLLLDAGIVGPRNYP
jgi:hypothetical protein